MLIEQGWLFGFGRWFEDHTPPVRYTVPRTQPRDLAHRLLPDHGRQVCAVAVGLLVARHELWPVTRQHRHEVFACAVLQVQHARPQPGGSGGAGCLDDLLEQLGAVGQPGEDRGHADADVDARRGQLFDRPQPLSGMRGARLGLPPDLVVERRASSPRRTEATLTLILTVRPYRSSDGRSARLSKART